MKALFVTQTGAAIGGAERSLLLLLEHLPARVCASALLFDGGAFAEALRRRGFPVTLMPVPSRILAIRREHPLQLRSAMPLLRALLMLHRELATLRPDVVHTNSIKAHLMVAPVAWSLRIPVVMHVRDLLPGISRIALSVVGRAFAARRIAISHAVARWYDMPMEIVFNPVALPAYNALPSRSDARAALGIPDDRPVIGIVGRINRWKGHDRFLRIVALVNSTLPIRAIIVGDAVFRDTEFVPELRRLILELGLEDVVRFIDWRDDVRPAYAALDVHCNCSEREPFGRSIAEAAAAGCPTVAFDDGGASDIIEHGVNGRLVPGADESRFAECILDYLRDPLRREGEGQAARCAVKRFDPRHHAERIANVLDDAVGGGNVRVRTISTTRP